MMRLVLSVFVAAFALQAQAQSSLQLQPAVSSSVAAPGAQGGQFDQIEVRQSGPSVVSSRASQNDLITLNVRQALPYGIPSHVCRSQAGMPAVIHAWSADPEVASIDVPGVPCRLFLTGRKPGKTTVFILDGDGRSLANFDLEVTHDLQTLIDQIKLEVPGADIQIEPSANNSLVVRGRVRTPLQARQVIETAQAYLDGLASGSGAAGGGGGSGGGAAGRNGRKIINQLKVEQSSQINIQVRAVEMSRTMSHELGFDWSAVLSTSRGVAGAVTGGMNIFSADNLGGALFDGAKAAIGAAVPQAGGIAIGGMRTRGNFSLGVLLSAMQGEGLASVLAEPNLTAMSGETAAFAAGGEVPIVIINQNNIQIDYKSYGVILRMTPTLLSSNRISLRVAPEVSELTSEGSVVIPGGTTIPAFKVRRADTTVELASGQSFALAGMLRSSSGQVVNGIPGLRSIPMLGRFFESESTKREETELVILVTAYVVDPVSPGALQVPGRGTSEVDSLMPTTASAGYLF